MKTNLEKLKNHFTFDIFTEKQTDEIINKTCEAILKDIDEAGWNRYIEGNEITRLIRKGLKK